MHFHVDALYSEARFSSSLCQVIGSVLRVHGELRFLGNNLKGLGGGTLYVLSQGQVMLSPGARMIFEDNRGVYDIGREGELEGGGGGGVIREGDREERRGNMLFIT